MNIKVPTFIVDKEKCISNIRMMHAKAIKSNVLFRPHFKTHQSAEIGKWFRDEGIKAITVSSVSMAEYFAGNGWDDITIAIPVNINEIESINKLAEKIKLNLLADSFPALQFISGNLKHNFGIFLKIDTGYHRTGIAHDDYIKIDESLRIICSSSKMNFRGFLTHNGNTYSASSKNEISIIFKSSNAKMNLLKERYIRDFSDIIISVGDTPSCSIVNDFSDVDEIRPGNFIFYDAMQYFLGSCNHEQIAASLACPVVSKNNERCELVIYGGAAHFSKDFVLDKNNNRVYGLVASPIENCWNGIIPGTCITSLTQEHGIIKTSKEFFNKTEIGDMVLAIPAHSCLCAANFSEYTLTTNKKITK